MPPRPPVDLHHALGHASTDKRLEILRRVGECGSISEAARAAGVSYKAAWQAVDTLSNLAGTPLVERAVGGRGGGGAMLTPAGHELLQAATRLQQARQAVLEQIARSPSASAAAAAGPGPAALGLRTSMRNALPCRVTALRAQGGAVTVMLTAAGGDRLAARLTRESVQLLDLVPGREVLALFKAAAVDMLPAGAEAGGRNAIAGEVVRASRVRNGEVALRSAGGHSVVGFAASGPEGGPGLRVGARAVAVFDAAAVVIALPA